MSEQFALLQLAARAIAAASRGQGPAQVSQPPALAELPPQGNFVTLNHDDGTLRGCRGALEPARPLAQSVIHNAIATAIDDPRFSPVTADELGSLHVKLSLLSPLAPLAFSDREDLVASLAQSRPGLLIASGYRSATFLPSVWDSLADPSAFLTALTRKAGIRGWPDDLQAWVYDGKSTSGALIDLI